MNRPVRIAIEMLGMVFVVVCACSLSFRATEFFVKAATPPKPPNLFARLVSKGDVFIDSSRNVRYKGVLLGRLRKDEVRKRPVEIEKAPNGLKADCFYLGDGTWLLSGGQYDSKSDRELPEMSADNFLFQERTKRFLPLPPLSKARKLPSVLKLTDGRILIFGGWDSKGAGFEPLIELLDLTSNTCSSIGRSTIGREGATLSEIAPNVVLAISGDYPNTPIVEIIRVNQRSCTPLGYLNKPRFGAVVFKASAGEYLVVGGCNQLSEPDSNDLPAELITLRVESY
ncbi:MAG: hypothetical protein JST01_10895 [Cyanobacteria bacterium SZAS TMP-1]|nr:hypothetical protein [Cyanobacteria bacterium SZAS TMP-1]